MSFILDALKKSEMERQRQTVPGLLDAGGAAPRPRFPLWAVALALLLAINAAVVSVMLVRSPRPTGATVVTAQIGAPGAARAAVDSQPAQPPPPAHFSPMDAPPVYAPEIPVPAADGDDAPPAPKIATSLHRPEPVLGPKTAPPGRDAASDPDEILPTMAELNLTGAQALPELHLDVHVYATSPAERFVYVNMRKYREGAVLQEGPKVERIRRDGVVLDYEGLRFLLSRQ